MPNAPTISIIIPCWNDAQMLQQLLAQITWLSDGDEIIIADASQSPDSQEVAHTHDARMVTCEQPNRGAQMNAGAAIANGDVLLFHHADTQLTEAHLNGLRHAFTHGDAVGGAFHRHFDNRHPHLRWLEHTWRILSRHGGTLYGDQSVFVRCEVFASLGGFASIPLMEDVDFSRRLRSSGKVVILDPPIASSARKFTSEGSWLTSLQNATFLLLFKLGISPHTLHRWYYRHRTTASHPLQQ